MANVPNIDPVTGKNKGGRPLGSLSRMTIAAREKAALTGDMPHEFLLRVARGEVIPYKVLDQDTGEVRTEYTVPNFEQRVDAAKAAAPYYAPKISTVEVITGVSENELDAIIASAAAEAGVSLGFDGEGEEGPPPGPSRERRRAT